ncbi:MAG: murein biosynthesis integral membrane protein MurJ [Paracoccaceae bacterium]
MRFTSTIFKNFYTVSIWTFISRLFGFVRDIMLAAFLGSGPVGEAFIIAFSLPNIFRRFFAEGAFNAAFIPLFKKQMHNKEEAVQFTLNTLSTLILVLLTFCSLAILLMPFLVFAMASGFGSDSRFELTVYYGRITFPYIFMVSLSSLFGGILNSHGNFKATSAAPVILNIFLIFALLLSHVWNLDTGLMISISIPLSGLTQLLILIQASRRLGFSFKIVKPKFDKNLRRLTIIAFPAILSGGVIHVNLLVGRQIASHFEGAIAWLNYADRLYQLPLGVIGIALGSVLLPTLSGKSHLNNPMEMNKAVHQCLKIAAVLTLPATAALIIIPLPLVSVLFERGLFSNLDSQSTAKALAIYALGLPAYVLHKIFTPIFFSQGDTSTPFKIAVIAMLANLLLALSLINFLGYLSPVLSTTISSWMMAGLLYQQSRSLGFRISFSSFTPYLKILLATSILSLILIIVSVKSSQLLIASELRSFYLVFLILFCSAVYFFILWSLGINKKTFS